MEAIRRAGETGDGGISPIDVFLSDWPLGGIVFEVHSRILLRGQRGWSGCAVVEWAWAAVVLDFFEANARTGVSRRWVHRARPHEPLEGSFGAGPEGMAVVVWGNCAAWGRRTLGGDWLAGCRGSYRRRGAL